MNQLRLGKCVSIVTLALLLSGNASWAAKDPSLAPITSSQLKEGISSSKLNLDAKLKLVHRAYWSRISDRAYELCDDLWSRSPNNPDANLLRGEAAYLYFHESSFGWFRRTRSAPTEDPYSIANTCLEKAYKLNGKSPVVARVYGRFIFENAINRKLGYQLIEKSIAQDPKNPEGYTLLGLFYDTPGTEYENDRKAVGVLKRAISLDPNDSDAHSLLGNAYWALHDLKMSKKEEAISNSLLALPYPWVDVK